MKTTKMMRSLFALLLAAVMLLPTMPVARAASDGKCSVCGTACTQIVLKQANCHEQGVVEFICVNSKCSAYKVSVLEKTDIAPNDHDSICTDNGDGLTHTAHCIYHSEYKNDKEPHTFVNGYCTKCAAADYSQAEIVMASEVEIHADLGDTQTQLSVGKVAIMVGNVDITKNYTISYSWADSTGKVVGTGETYVLPAGATAKEDTLLYGCYVMAMPKSDSTGKHITASCMVSVHVRDMISANAIVGNRDDDFTLGQTNATTGTSVLQQLYEAIYESSEAYPSYVVFDKAVANDAGQLLVDGSKYYFTAKDNQKKLSDVKFLPTTDGAGTYTIRFSAFDTKGKEFPGILTISVERELGSLDIAYFTQQGENIQLDSNDFVNFWYDANPNGMLKQVIFTQLPTINEGTFYYNYNPSAAQNTPLKDGDLLHLILSNSSQYLIDGVTFVPAGKFSGQVVVPFDMYGLTSTGFYVQEQGELSIFIDSGKVEDISVSMTNGTEKPLSAESFLSVYQSTTGRKDSAFSIKLLDVPENGALYVDYTGTTRDVALSADTILDYTFYFDSDLSHEIADLTYVSDKSNKTLTDTLRYLACDEKGEFLYMGEIVFTCKSAVVVYTKSFTDVKKGDWFYQYVMDLAETGVINGFEEKIDGETVISYKPQNNVTYAEALKLILLAVGYNEPAKTGKHWASGYLELAIAENLVTNVLTEARLDDQISRNMIAQIAARAMMRVMELPKTTRTESPLKDVTMDSVYAPYILALYDAGIINGDDNGNYNGTKKITRAEMATIVWRINNYTA